MGDRRRRRGGLDAVRVRRHGCGGQAVHARGDLSWPARPRRRDGIRPGGRRRRAARVGGVRRGYVRGVPQPDRTGSHRRGDHRRARRTTPRPPRCGRRGSRRWPPESPGRSACRTPRSSSWGAASRLPAACCWTLSDRGWRLCWRNCAICRPSRSRHTAPTAGSSGRPCTGACAGRPRVAATPLQVACPADRPPAPSVPATPPDRRRNHEGHRHRDRALRVRVVAADRRREHPRRDPAPRRPCGVRPHRRGHRRRRRCQPARRRRHPDALRGGDRRGSARSPGPVGADDPRLVQAGQRGGRRHRDRRHRQRPVGSARQDRRRPAVEVLRGAGAPRPGLRQRAGRPARRRRVARLLRVHGRPGRARRQAEGGVRCRCRPPPARHHARGAGRLGGRADAAGGRQRVLVTQAGGAGHARPRAHLRHRLVRGAGDPHRPGRAARRVPGDQRGGGDRGEPQGRPPVRGPAAPRCGRRGAGEPQHGGAHHLPARRRVGAGLRPAGVADELRRAVTAPTWRRRSRTTP